MYFHVLVLDILSQESTNILTMSTTLTVLVHPTLTRNKVPLGALSAAPPAEKLVQPE